LLINPADIHCARLLLILGTIFTSLSFLYGRLYLYNKTCLYEAVALAEVPAAML